MAFGNATFSDAGAAVSDLFGGIASGYRAQGDLAEAAGYGTAAKLAGENVKYEEAATQIQEVQAERQAMRVIGGQQADVAGYGFAASGTALDLLRSSAQQGALAHQLIGEQGAIQVNAYQAQQASYQAMQAAAESAAKGEEVAGIGKFISGGINSLASIATLFTRAS